MMETQQKSQNTKELRSKANDFLNSRQNANNLVELMTHFKQCLGQRQPLTSVLMTLEVIYTEILKRGELLVEVTPLKPKEESPESKYREWLKGHYEEFHTLLLSLYENEKNAEAFQALGISMKLLAVEAKSTMAGGEFPKQRFRSILQHLISTKKPMSQLIQRFHQEYALKYWDIVFYGWKLLQFLGSRTHFENEVFALNYLELLSGLAVSQELQESKPSLCSAHAIKEGQLEYMPLRKFINKLWFSLIQWNNGQEAVHKQLLILLLERVLPHLDKPIQLTDFLMDSLDCGGVISLLALQGMFTLIQKHNVTYPDIYEKLYSMFEPEIFHTKFKARLFYLADIFLSSTHLPESLVAAFVKRLARLALIAPPQDAIIILYFIGNLILRHSGLKRLISAQTAVEYASDPFVMEERNPAKSNALDSSLWEVVALQKHAIPAVATAAKFISQPLPQQEWDLSSVLEVKEDDMFDQEISKKTKQYALAFERPQGLYLNKNDVVQEYWRLF